mgnify:CR=1 FL=1
MFEAIAEHFNRLAPTYDANPLYQLVGRAEMGYDVTGYDIASNMVAQARSKVKQLGVHAEFTDDAAAIAGRQWPLVLCMGVLDYYRDPATLLRLVVPHLAPGGTLIVGAPNLYGPFSWGHSLICLFRLRMYMHTAAGLIKAAERLGMRAAGVTYAFPAIAPVGMTVLIAFRWAQET